MSLKDILREKDVRLLCKHLFNVDITPYQEKIVRVIAFSETKRFVVTAYTQWGKTYAVALGVSLYIILNEDKKIILLAPRKEQTSILRNYIAQWITRCSLLLDILDLDSTGPERIRREVSKSRMTFKNGIELRTLSAEGTGMRLMGFGANLVISDEDGDIGYEVWKQKISRMLGNDPDSMHVSIGNPWHRNNQFYRHWTDPNYLKIHVDWRIGIEEGRITREFVEEQRAELSPLEFTILYESMFPEESEDQLIRTKWIDEAEKREIKLGTKGIISIAGLDVAEMGRDLTVLGLGRTKDNKYVLDDIHSWGKKDTMVTVGKVRALIDKKVKIRVDATGVGSGVHARLAELNYNSVGVKVGESPDRESQKSRFMNKKAEYYWRLRELFESGMISIPIHPKLRRDLQSLRYEPTSSGKIKIIDARSAAKKSTMDRMMVEGKSPDFSDMAMLLVSAGGEFKMLLLEDDDEVIF